LTSTEGGGEGTWTYRNPAASISFRIDAAGHQLRNVQPEADLGSLTGIDPKVRPLDPDPVKRL